MTHKCGISRNGKHLQEAIEEIPRIRERFWNDVCIPGDNAQFNQSLEHAGRLADYLEFAELMCRDALDRDESAGCHFREEHQTEEGEAERDDEKFANVSVWEHTGDHAHPKKHVEPLEFEKLPLATRNYKT
jgi:succinate dehydrogenase / fumarate reductase flavoprotein subunit